MKLPITGKLFAKVPEDDPKVLKKPDDWELCASDEWMITTWLRVDYEVTIGVEWDVNKLYSWPRFSSMAQAFNHVKVGGVVIKGLTIKKWESPALKSGAIMEPQQFGHVPFSLIPEPLRNFIANQC